MSTTILDTICITPVLLVYIYQSFNSGKTVGVVKSKERGNHHSHRVDKPSTLVSCMIAYIIRIPFSSAHSNVQHMHLRGIKLSSCHCH